MPSRSRRMRRLYGRALRLVPVPAASSRTAAVPNPAPASRPAVPPGRNVAARTQGSLALAEPVSAPPVPPPPRTARRGRPAGQPPPRGRPVAGRPRRTGGLEEAAQLMAQLVADVLTGSRPALHLAGRVSPRVYEALATAVARRRVLVTAGRPIVWRTHICRPAAGVAEVSAVAHDAARAYPLALRLERDRDRWRCVAVAAPRTPGTR